MQDIGEWNFTSLNFSIIFRQAEREDIQIRRIRSVGNTLILRWISNTFTVFSGVLAENWVGEKAIVLRRIPYDFLHAKI